MNNYEIICSLFDDMQESMLPNAIGYHHEPKVAPMYYRYLFYKPLSKRHLSSFLKSCNFNVSQHLINFYGFCNGLRINQRLSIFGSLPEQGLQPISLEYGNLFECPDGLPRNSTVIGGLELSENANGYLIVHEDGVVTCTSSFLEFDEVRNWPDIKTLLCEEIEIAKRSESV